MLRFLVFSNAWVSFCYASLVVASFLLTNVSFDLYYLLFSFFGVLGVYNLQRWVKIQENSTVSSRDEWLKKRKNQLLLIGLFSLVVSFTAYLFSDYNNFLVLIVCGVLTFFYVPPHPFRFVHLRASTVSKLISVALVWSILSFPGIDILIDWKLWVSRGIWVIGITIPFDIRDVYQDEVDGIKNVAYYLGEKRSVLLSMLAFSFGMINEWIFIGLEIRWMFPTFILGNLFLYLVTRTKRELYIASIIEMIPVIYCLNYLMIKYF